VDDDYTDQSPPEVTISPADNGHVVRWHQRSGKKGESGRSVTRVALSVDEALDHAKSALSGGSAKSPKKKSTRDGQTGAGMSDAEGESGSTSSPAAHHRSSRNPARSARRRRSRIGGRRA
jgi:hypothetical protein